MVLTTSELIASLQHEVRRGLGPPHNGWTGWPGQGSGYAALVTRRPQRNQASGIPADFKR